MAKLANWKLQKAQDRFKASNAKPERPRIDEQVGLEKSLVNMQREISADDKQIDGQMYDELSDKWKSNGGGDSGDAFVSGLTAGLKKGSSSEEKDRTKKLMKFTEQMRDMVAQQNIQLFEAEKLDKARSSVAPRIMAYLDSYQKMSPNDRKVYLQNALQEYNQVAGTNYSLLDTAGAEPWKVMVSDDGEISPLDLMDFIKTPDEKKLDYYYKSNEVQDYEKSLAQDDNIERQIMQSKIAQNQAKVQRDTDKADRESPQRIQEKKQQMVESGEIPEGTLLFDELPQKEALKHFDDIKIERDKGKGAKNGIKALEEMGKIFKDNPKISTSMAKWASSQDDSLLSNYLKGAVNQKERAALEQLEKHAARLALGTIEQFKGMRPTDILKKLIRDTNPGSKFSYEAFIPISEQYIEEFNEQLSRSEEANRALLKRYVPTYENIRGSSTATNQPQKDAPVNIDAAKQRMEELNRREQEILSKKRGS